MTTATARAAKIITAGAKATAVSLGSPIMAPAADVMARASGALLAVNVANAGHAVNMAAAALWLLPGGLPRQLGL